MRDKPTKLTPDEEMSLAELAVQPGFKVLEKLIKIHVTDANEAVFKVKPDDPDHTGKSSRLQLVAYALNDFAAQLIRDVNHQLDKARVEAARAAEARVITAPDNPARKGA